MELAILLAATTVIFFFFKKNRQQVKVKQRASFKVIADSLTSKESESLSAYEHYFDCRHPEQVKEGLQRKGLITPVDNEPNGKFAITPLGYSVARMKGLLSGGNYVCPVSPPKAIRAK